MTGIANRRVVTTTAVALAALSVGCLATGSDMLPIWTDDESHQLVFLLGLGVGVALLVAVAWTRLPLTVAGWIVVAVAGLVGTALSMLITRETACCMFSLTVYDGYPFPWRTHNITQDTYLSPAELHRHLRENPGAFSHYTDPLSLVADALFWASLALAVVVPVRWVWWRRAVTARTADEPVDA